MFYSSVSTYVGLYGSGLFNFESYVSFPTLFACFLGFGIPTSSFTFIEIVFIILVYIYVYIDVTFKSMSWLKLTFNCYEILTVLEDIEVFGNT